MDSFFFEVNLNTLDLASNEITRIENLSHLNKMEEFWVCEVMKEIQYELLYLLQYWSISNVVIEKLLFVVQQ